MRLTRKKVEEIIKNLLSEEGLPLVKELYDRQNISEFELASKTKKDIKVIRRLLYMLYNHNLVYFSRKKDKEKGWYIYYWTLSPENIRFLYYKKKREELAQGQEQLARERKELFFTCPKRCVRLTFDHAMDFEFHCPECGELTQQDSTLDKISQLKQQIADLQEELREEERESKSRARRKQRPVKAAKKVKKR
ncbi:MAG: hypothetical protein AABX13_02265 [Nanoarchaeota archaeon]